MLHVNTDNMNAKFMKLVFFPFKKKSFQHDQSPIETGMLVYAYERHGKMASCLVLLGVQQDDIISYLKHSSPEIYMIIAAYLEKDSLYLDLKLLQAWNSNGPINTPDIKSLLEALNTITYSPKRNIDISNTNGIVSIILAGGKGSRLHSRDTQKVCFPIAGRPAINRLLDQLESVGIHEHIVVAGEKGRQLVNEITEVRDGVTFVYQINQIGTGNAAKQAAYQLRSQNYKGNILLVLGDKVLEKSALLRLMQNFHTSKADFAIMTADKKIWPDAGRVVTDRKGQPVDIVEKPEIQKMIISKRLLELKRKRTFSKTLHKEILKEITSLSKAKLMFPNLMKNLEENKYINLKELEKLIPEAQTSYQITKDGQKLTYTGEELEKETPISNVSVYMFTSDAFFNSIFSIKSNNAQKEEYFTDMVRLLSQDSKKSWKIIPVPVKDRNEALSFNNPEELLQIEEYYTAKETSTASSIRSCARLDVTTRKNFLRPIEEWLNALEGFDTEIKNTFRHIYGDDIDILNNRRSDYLKALRKFVKVYGTKKSVIIARSPGRVNLMGRHIDHRGGFANFMTINNEALLIASLREDDIIETHNIDSHRFRPFRFSIGKELSRLPWDEWLNIISSETVHEMIRASYGDWSNYFKAAALRLQEKFKDRLLYGFNGIFSSNIPLAAGMSSSSAVIISTAEVLTLINGLMFVPKEFVDLCGESEWFVGTREESGNYMAMKMGEKGKIIHMGFHKSTILKIFQFPKDYRLVLLLLHQYPSKSEDSMQIRNEKIAAYEIAQAIVKSHFKNLKKNIEYFRDINTDHLGLKSHEIYDILMKIPEQITRKKVMKLIQKDDKDYIEKYFSTHKEPDGGYTVRKTALFGLAEIERAKMLPHLVEKNEIETVGHLMTISHNGERISKLDNKGEQVKYDNSTPDTYIQSLRNHLSRADNSGLLYLQPGGYGGSTPLIDEMVDISLTIKGVVGTQLSGTGLGGCIMSLVKEEAVDNFINTMNLLFYKKNNLQERIFVCSPVTNSGILSI